MCRYDEPGIAPAAEARAPVSRRPPLRRGLHPDTRYALLVGAAVFCAIVAIGAASWAPPY